jgi:hypothetical protein
MHHTAHCVLAAALFVAAAMVSSARAAGNNFSPSDVLNGTKSSEEACTGSAVWVVVEGKGDCIVYYAGGLQARNSVAVIFFQGDLINRQWDLQGNTVGQTVNPFYGQDSAANEAKVANRWAVRIGEPYIFLARPGTFGSSGDHKERRRLREVLLVDAAIDAIKKRHQIDSLVLVGQSSGGHLVGAMLAKRSDISCAVAASGVTAVRRRVELHGWQADATGFRDYWDPADHVDDIKASAGLRIFVLGDHDDANVPFAAQSYWFDLLKKHDLDATLLSGTAMGPEHHELGTTGRIIAGLCAHGVPTDTILEAAKQLKG